MTQEPAPSASAHPGRASLSNLRHCLRKLAHEVETSDIKSLALPRLSTGVGGLDWKEVEPVIEEYFKNSKTEVLVYDQYVKDVGAAE